MAFELGADVVHLRRRALALEHADADLDRVAHRLGRRVAGLGPLANELGGAAVVDGQRLDHEPVAERADVLVAGLIELELWSFGRFHGNLRR